MAAIFADDIFKCIFMNEKFYIFIRISPKFDLKGPNDNKSALVQVMAWRRTDNKPLPEPMLTQFNNAYMQHKGELSLSPLQWSLKVHVQDILVIAHPPWGMLGLVQPIESIKIMSMKK